MACCARGARLRDRGPGDPGQQRAARGPRAASCEGATSRRSRRRAPLRDDRPLRLRRRHDAHGPGRAAVHDGRGPPRARARRQRHRLAARAASRSPRSRSLRRAFRRICRSGEPRRAILDELEHGSRRHRRWCCELVEALEQTENRRSRAATARACARSFTAPRPASVFRGSAPCLRAAAARSPSSASGTSAATTRASCAGTRWRRARGRGRLDGERAAAAGARARLPWR